jgi:hypothetical protein
MENIKKLLGKTFLYRGNQIKIENYSVQNGGVTLVTDKGFIDKKESEIDSFIFELQPVSYAPVVQTQIDSSVIGNLKDILMDNIAKVKADANFIPQSEEINKNVKSIIDLAKTEIEMVKIIRGI